VSRTISQCKKKLLLEKSRKQTSNSTSLDRECTSWVQPRIILDRGRSVGNLAFKFKVYLGNTIDPQKVVHLNHKWTYFTIGGILAGSRVSKQTLHATDKVQTETVG
jgi:hypothetical protein